MRSLIVALSLTSVLLTGCAQKAEVDELTVRLDALEKKVTELEARPAAGGGNAVKLDPEAEKKATELLKSSDEAMKAGNIAKAKADIDEIFKSYGSTQVAKKALRTKQELEVVGKKVANPKPMEKWYTGTEKAIHFDQGTTLVVFWEVWCPHCQREVPKLQEMSEKYKGKMEIVGLTRITKSATEEKVVAFLDENKVTYPTAKEDGSVAEQFNVSGIPAAAVVKNGEIVWRGHPASLSEDMINAFLAG